MELNNKQISSVGQLHLVYLFWWCFHIQQPLSCQPIIARTLFDVALHLAAIGVRAFLPAGLLHGKLLLRNGVNSCSRQND